MNLKVSLDVISIFFINSSGKTSCLGNIPIGSVTFVIF